MSTLTTEQETTITYNVAEDNACLWSASPIFHRQMARLGVEPFRVDKDSAGKVRSAWYQVPKKWIKVRPPKAVSEKQRQTMRENSRFLSRKPSVQPVSPPSLTKDAREAVPGEESTEEDAQ